ncbi:MAG TPA: Maf family protein [Bacillota bacterium]|nr:Maf family protein [Bacillota bacterium]
MAEALAAQKARAVAAQLTQGLVLGADTIVVKGSPEKGHLILGKPADGPEAAVMLRSLSGTSHQVITGVALIEAATGRERLAHEITEVRFRELQEEEITAYITSGEPLDKAGAYAIQGLGAVFVAGINGCYSNVVGLPLARLSTMLSEFGIRVL